MSDPDLLPTDHRPAPSDEDGTAAGHGSGDGASPRRASDVSPLLARLNRRGFRLVQLADATVLWLVVVGTMVVRHGWRWPTYPMPLYFVSFFVIVVIFLASLYFGGLYEREPRLGFPPTLPRAFRQTLAAGGLVALLNLAATGAVRELGLLTGRALPMPTTNLIVLIVAGAMLVAFNRQLVARLRSYREGPPRVLLVGPSADVMVARAHISGDPKAALVVAEVSDASRLVDDVLEHEATDVVLLSSRWLDSLYPDVISALEQLSVTTLLRVSGKETMFGLERVRQIGGLPFVLLRAQTMPASRARFKRLTDLLILLAVAPVVVALAAVLVAYQLIVAGRPLLYWQTRVGARGEPFRMVKFRTMIRDAEADGEVVLADVDDARVIPACRWLRRTRLDELPQLWNVLRGQMSLVGPRPERPELTARFEELIPGYARRYEIAPGITGLAQIHGHYHTDPEYKLGYDLQYLVNWSPVLDLEILLRTAWVVGTGRA